VQSGFRAMHGTIDQVYNLDRLIRRYKMERYRKTKTSIRHDSIYLAFLDVKQAYDTVDRSLLWRKLGQQTRNGFMLRMLKTLFDGNQSKVRLNGFLSNARENEIGLFQGSVLSPILYSWFINDFPRELREGPGIELGGQIINSLLYADDIALIANDAQDMRRLLQMAERYQCRNNFLFNAAKCEVIQNNTSKTKFYLNDVQLANVETFVYLGIDVNDRGVDALRLAQRRTQLAEQTARLLQSVGLNRYAWPFEVRLIAFKTMIRPVYEYGSVLMLRNSKALAKLSSTQHNILCQMLGTRPSTSKNRVHSFWGVQKAEDRVHDLAARWLLQARDKPSTCLIHHTMAMQTKLKRTLQARIEERGVIGRYQTQSTDHSRRGIAKAIARETINSYIPTSEPAYGISRRCRDELRTRLKEQRQQIFAVRWMMRAVLGKPEKCPRCGQRLVYLDHLERCSGIAAGLMDRLIKARRFDHVREIIPPLMITVVASRPAEAEVCNKEGLMG
jgi:Reverse transcriptase (RNA-dependent DNA polymerase)